MVRSLFAILLAHCISPISRCRSPLVFNSNAFSLPSSLIKNLLEIACCACSNSPLSYPSLLCSKIMLYNIMPASTTNLENFLLNLLHGCCSTYHLEINTPNALYASFLTASWLSENPFSFLLLENLIVTMNIAHFGYE